MARMTLLLCTCPAGALHDLPCPPAHRTRHRRHDLRLVRQARRKGACGGTWRGSGPCNLATERAQVEHARDADAQALVAAVTRLGYAARPVTAGDDTAATQAQTR